MKIFRKKKKKPLQPRLMQIWMWDDTESVCSTIYLFDLTFPSRLLQFGKGVPIFLRVMSGNGHIITH
jgi:hypothetical protein